MPVDLERRDHVALVTLNRPDALNAMSPDMFDDLDARLDEIAARLTEQLAVAGSLVKFQVEMTNHEIETGMNKLASEVLATRERARLEAMAFEI